MKNPSISANARTAATDYYGAPVYAVGWDRASVILRVLQRGKWMRYRLPFGSQSWSHTWNTEWMRIRFAQTERHLMDAFGLFYDLPNLVYGEQFFGVQPVARHLRVVPDFTHFNGYFVMASWWGSIDDLWSFGKSAGWGAVWEQERVAAGAVSDPFLMTGFAQKSVTLVCSPAAPVLVDIEVDVLGNGEWRKIARLDAGRTGLAFYSFAPGFAAHWARAKAVSPAAGASVSFGYR